MQSNLTKALKLKEIKRDWYLYNAKDQFLGRLAEKVAKTLMGKGKISQYPNLDAGDGVVVTNISALKVSGGKEKKKTYYRYSGYPGGLKSETYEKLFARKPEDVLRLAVKGMLPENKFQSRRLARLKIYRDENYPKKLNLIKVEL